MARTLFKAGWIAPQSALNTDPSTNGSGYLWVPAYSIGEVPSGTAQLTTDYFTGRDQGTLPVPGADGGAIEVVTPVIGLPTEAGDGVSSGAGADDWNDCINENHVTDSPTEREGENVLSSGAAEITFDAAATNLVPGDLIAVYDAAALPGRTQWALLVSGTGAGPYVTAPAWEEEPTAAAIAYAARQYVWTTSTLGGSHQAWTLMDSNVDGGNTTYYRCLDGRLQSRSIVFDAGQRIEDRQTWMFDSIVEDRANKTNLPTPGVSPAVSPLVGLYSGVWFNGTAYATKRVSIDFNIEMNQVDATSGPNGRAGFEILKCQPTITIEPEATDALRDLKRGMSTSGPLLVQLGAGVFGTVLNTCAFHAASAYVMEAARTDDGGRARQTVTFKVCDPGSTTFRYWQFARA